MFFDSLYEHPPPPPRTSESTPVHYPLQIQSLIAYRGDANPPLIYDVTVLPSCQDIANNNRLEPEKLHESAFYPPVHSIVIPGPLLMGTIQVLPSGDAPYVTILDVLEAIYRHLRLPITAKEYTAIPERENLNLRRSVDMSYFERCSRFADPALARKRGDRKKGRKDGQVEALRGIRHLDLLLGRHQFLGLIGSPVDSDALWELRVR